MIHIHKWKLKEETSKYCKGYLYKEGYNIYKLYKCSKCGKEKLKTKWVKEIK